MQSTLRFRVFVLMTIISMLCIPVSSTQAQEVVFSDSFDNPELSGWEHTPGVYVIDGALRIEPENFAGRPGEWAEMELHLIVRRLSPGDFVVSYQNSDSGGYHVLISASRITLQLESAEGLEELAAAEIDPIPEEEWFSIAIVVSGNEHTVLINDGPPVLNKGDLTQGSPGGISIETFAEATIEVMSIELIDHDHETISDENGTAPATEVFPSSSEPDSSGAAGITSQAWVYTGGPSGGLGYDIRMDPRDPDVMYVTDAWAGAFKSKDGGATWSPINNGITARVGPSGDGIPVFSLTIDPNNPDTLWAGTQFGGGVFRSDDAGESWVSKSNGILEQALTIRGFTVEPGNSAAVYLGGEISSWEWSGTQLPGLGLDMTKGVVYKTTDGGENWKRIWFGDNLTRYIWIHPQNHNLIYVSTGIFDREAANSNPDTLEPGGVGILRSRDGGENWEVLGVSNGIRADELYFGSLSMHSQNPDILVGAAGNDPYLWALDREIGAIYRTENGGDSWERVLHLPNASAVEICDSDPNIVYAASLSGFYRSSDGGKSWDQQGGTGDLEQTGAALWGPPDVVAGFPIDMQCDPRDPMRIFVNNYGGGNFLSEDGGETWMNASSGYTGALMHSVVVAADNPNQIYASARSGIFKSMDGGETWEGMSRGPARAMEAVGIAVNPNDSSHLITVITDAGPVPKISYDNGQSWQEAEHGIGDSSFFDWGAMKKMQFSPAQEGLVIGIQGENECLDPHLCQEEGHGVLFSQDGGKTWNASKLNYGMGTELAFSSDGTVYVNIYPGDLYRSTDGGENWEQLAVNLTANVELEDPDPEIPGPILIAIAVDPQNSNKIYAGFYRGGVMISEDRGKTWSTATFGMDPEASIFDLVVDDTRADRVYAAAHDSGVYMSTDGGKSWSGINNGLVTRAGVSLGLSADGSVLYLATTGGGVFRLGTPSSTPPGTQLDTEAETQESEKGPVGDILPCPGSLVPLALVGMAWSWTHRKEKDVAV